MLRGFEIINRNNGSVENFIDCEGKRDRSMDKIYDALCRKVDLDKFFIREVGR